MSNPTTPPYPQQPHQPHPQQPNQQPHYAPPALPAPQPTTLAQTNTFALISMLLAFFQPIAGIVFGHMALSQIKRNGDAGRGLALTGLIISYVIAALTIFLVIAYISVIFVAIATIPYGTL